MANLVFPTDYNSGLHAPRERPKTQNVVATLSVGCQLDLKHIVTRSRNSEYNPKKFAAVIMRIRDPKSTALIFQTGKIVVTGAQSEEKAQMAGRKYARIIQKLDFPAQFKDFKIQNIVGSCDVGFPIRLEGLAHEHSDRTSYEPELFPGLIFRMMQPKVVTLIFVSGKIVLTGARTKDNINHAFDKIYPLLLEYKKDSDHMTFDDDDDDDDEDEDDNNRINNDDDFDAYNQQDEDIDLNTLNSNSTQQNIQNIQNLQNMQNMQNIQNIQNVQNMQNVQNVQNFSNLQNSQQNINGNMNLNAVPNINQQNIGDVNLIQPPPQQQQQPQVQSSDNLNGDKKNIADIFDANFDDLDDLDDSDESIGI